MPAVQKQFEDFHDAIKLENDVEKASLRTKREVLIRNLKEQLGDDAPSFVTFNQGSYSMHTGVFPLDGNYDIDVGVIFDCSPTDFPDPVVLKKMVRDALNTHGRTVLIRRPCVTVNYVNNGVTDYHVDLVLYTKRDDGLLAIGKGREHSAQEFRFWEAAEPKGLTELICSAFTDDKDLAQYRRCIRYMKRWRDIMFRSGGAPLSIALTITAQQWFNPRFESSGKPADLLAMHNWVTTILNQFKEVTNTEGYHSRLVVNLPVTPGGDLMESMTKPQMENFKYKLEVLRDTLIEAYYEDLPEDACKMLKTQFGDDFKVPEKAQTAKATVAPVISTGNSA